MNTTPNRDPSDHPPGHPANLNPPMADDQRLTRIEDYRRQALANPDVLAANLGAINSDLMQIAFRLMKVTEQTLAESTQPCKDLGKVLPAIGMTSQITRQIQRFAAIEMQRQAALADEGGIPCPEKGTSAPTKKRLSEEIVA